jgi:hypothetical protein
MNVRKLAAVGRLVTVVCLGIGASACATIVGGTTQDLYIDSDPAGAACKIDRQGATVGMVNPTPGKTSVPRHKDNIVVSCTHDGYEQSNEVLASNFSGATLGNILLGGFVGVVIDASSGANNKYPERIVVILTPTSFPNDAARDAYYDGVKTRLAEQAKTEIKRIADGCNSNNREFCRIDEKKVTDARDAALAEIDRKRLAAKVVPAG